MNTRRRSGPALSVLFLLACAARSAAASEVPTVIIKSSSTLFAGLARADTVSVALQATGGGGSYAWSIVAGALPPGLTLSPNGLVSGSPTQPGSYSFTVKAIDEEQHFATKTFPSSVYAVPRPKPIDIPYTLSAIYMPKPSWPSHQWGDIRVLNEKNQIKAQHGQRLPLLGYYQGDSPEVLDWQIKMAVDRGITNFAFVDYWIEGFGPVYDESRRAFLKSNYRNAMTFSALYLACGTPGGSPAELRACFRQRALPWYVANLFNQPNYLRVDGKPVIQIGSFGNTFGTDHGPTVQALLDEADQYIAAHTPYSGAYWITCDVAQPTTPGPTPAVTFQKAKAAGFDAVSPYYVLPYLFPAGGWSVFPVFIPQPAANQTWPAGLPYGDMVQHSANLHGQGFTQAAAWDLKFITAIAPDFDSRTIWWSQRHLYFTGQSHTLYWSLLSAVRQQVDAHPGALAVSSNTGKPLVGLGPWNEQLESSTIEPGYSTFQRTGGGNGDPFFMASAAAMVFGGPASYDSFLPGDHGRPFPARSDWTFSTATGAGLDEWSGVATAGLSIGPGDVMVVQAPGRVELAASTFADTSAFRRVKVMLRVDEDPGRLRQVCFYAAGSDYSAGAHLFESPQEPGHQFLPTLPCRAVGDYATVDGFRVYTLEMAANPTWQGFLRFVQVRFELCQPPHPDVPPELWCAPGTPMTALRYSIKRVWME
jgi:hypothetical protein